MVFAPQGVNLKDLSDGVLLPSRHLLALAIHVCMSRCGDAVPWRIRLPSGWNGPSGNHGTLPARIESREKNDSYAHLMSTGVTGYDWILIWTTASQARLSLASDGKSIYRRWLRLAPPLIDGTEVAIAYSNGDIDMRISHTRSTIRNTAMWLTATTQPEYPAHRRP